MLSAAVTPAVEEAPTCCGGVESRRRRSERRRWLQCKQRSGDAVGAALTCCGGSARANNGCDGRAGASVGGDRSGGGGSSAGTVWRCCWSSTDLLWWNCTGDQRLWWLCWCQRSGDICWWRQSQLRQQQRWVHGSVLIVDWLWKRSMAVSMVAAVAVAPVQAA